MTSVHSSLGEERMAAICAQHGISSADRIVIDQIFQRWESLVGKTAEKLRVAIELVGENPNRQAIINAVTQMSIEFAERRLRK